ncbi:NAD(P)H-dependent oxidoreductase [Arthrobacter sp. HY1533]|uniref:NAD(P)H-dependent oxidoreductase n=1 Tax=Arthrobacter sp. HY1533 TaxID=2970919 RepID=UPI0022B9EFC7|nr:NAD(P)H-dependent oxidoreductase [Arthrobacter sp. HY1533]
MIVLGIDGSPHGPGKTAAAVAAVLAGAASRGAETELVSHDHPEVLARIAAADAVVLGSPTYRASHTAALRTLLERIERKPGAEPLAGTPVAVVMTGASGEHFLGTRELAASVAGFFGTQVLAPDLYFKGSDFGPEGGPAGRAAELAELHGQALVDLAAAVRGSAALGKLGPVV